jgi:hypothetical protein
MPLRAATLSVTRSGPDPATIETSAQFSCELSRQGGFGCRRVRLDLAVGAETQGEPSEADYPGTLPDAHVNGTLDLDFARETVITRAATRSSTRPGRRRTATASPTA